MTNATNIADRDLETVIQEYTIKEVKAQEMRLELERTFSKEQDTLVGKIKLKNRFLGEYEEIDSCHLAAVFVEIYKQATGNAGNRDRKM